MFPQKIILFMAGTDPEALVIDNAVKLTIYDKINGKKAIRKGPFSLE
ncbi:hypothetical protein ACFL27_02330 [candidate division CSSED10-310 bacterium]|uniref:Uncharacterized protein n=1 Tax=candidate division CSSED10-310 bacterium TaxID=2855610 RepID=A0ABV6YS41_UNCC1